MRRENAFTLIEVLGVIIILTIIFLIAMPITSGIIEKVKREAFIESLNRLFNAYDLYLTNNDFNPDPTTLSVIDERLKLKSNFENGTIFLNNKETAEITKVSDGEFCAEGTKKDLKVVVGSCNLLDETEPIVNISVNKITSNSIKVVVEANDPESGIKGYYYSKDDGNSYTEISEQNEYIFEKLSPGKEYIIKVKVVNNNELETIKSIKVTTLNINIPIYEVDPTNWSKSKIVTITYPTIENQTLTYEYSIDKGSSWKTANEIQKVTFNANGTIIARVTDGVNVVTGSTFIVDKIDTIEPTMSVSENTTEWTTSKTLTVTASDTGGSGLHTSAYSFDDGKTWQTSNSKTITTNGTYYIKVRDNAGNETSQTVVVNKISTTAPTITIAKGNVGSNYITVTASVVDNEMGISKIEYSKDNGQSWVSGGTNTTYIFSGLTKNTSYTIKAKVTSKNGKSTTSNALTISTSNITTPTYAVSPSGWAKSKTVTITYPTIANQTLTYEYSLDKGSSWKTATQSQKVTFNANGTIIARVKDGTNTVTATTFTVNQIDTTVPTMSVSGNTTEWTTSKTLTVTASDTGGSSLHATAYSFDNGSSWQTGNSKTITTNGTYYVKVRDNAGNIASQTVVVSKISTTAPTITITKGNVGSNYITVNATVVDNEMGISKIEYSKDNGQSWVSGGTNKTYVFSGLTKNTSYTIKAKVTSKNGKSTISNALSVSTADITVPTYSVSPSGWAKSKTVTITYPTIANQTLTYEYSLDKGSSWKTATQSQKVTFNANGTIIARVKDGTNTITATTFTVNQIDTTVPTMSVSGNTTEWTTSKTLTVTASDTGGSSLHATAYSFDNGKTWQTGNSKTITTNGTYYIKVRDNAGNIASQTVVVSKISTTAPTITITKGNVGSNYITVNATVVDNEMGISKIEYSKDNGQSWVNAGTNATYVFSGLTKNTSYTIKAKVTSKNGKSTISNALSVSTANIASPTYAVSPSGWAKSKTVTITYPTIANQTLTYQYSTNAGSSWQTATQSQTITFNANGTIIARVKDGTNTVTATTFTVNQIDNNGPEIAVTASTSDWVIGSITLTINATDDGSGISGSAYSINGGSYSTTNTYTTSAAGNISIKVKDNVGNESTKIVKTETRTEYGYQDVSSWSSGYSTTTPSDGYYKSKTQYKVTYKISTPYTANDIVVQCGGTCGSAASYGCSSVVSAGGIPQSCGAGVTRCIGYGCTRYNTSTKTTDWQDNNTAPSGTFVSSTTRTVYAAPSAWGSATGWTTSGAYSKTTSRKPVTRTTIHYAG